MAKIYAVSAVAAMTVLVGGSLLFGLVGKSPHGDCADGQVAGDAIGGPFTLVDGDGKSVADTDVITEPALIYFGYTFCPDVCPFDIARNVAAVDILAERGIEAKPVFITVDPVRDTPEVVAEYAEAYHPKLVGLTGTEEQVKEAADAYRVYFKRHEADDEFYLVDHTSFTYLMFPNIGFADYFRRDATAEAVADSVACFTETI